MPLERLTMLVLPPTARAGARRAAARGDAGPEPGRGRGRLEIVDLGRDRRSVRARRVDCSATARIRARRIAVSDTLLGACTCCGSSGASPGAPFELASTVLRDLRMVKDADEIALLPWPPTPPTGSSPRSPAGRLVGRTEADVAREVRERLVAEGHDDGACSRSSRSGPNSASPHHEASERVIRAGEPIVLDIGGTLGGYGSDITRTLWVTGGDPATGPTSRVPAPVRRRSTARRRRRRAAVRPGRRVRGDRRRRAPASIEAEGYGEAFFHRTGHGIGLEGHEDPYLVAGNAEPLRAGHGLQRRARDLPRRASTARGSRTSSCAAPDGPIVLNEAPRELYVVDG